MLPNAPAPAARPATPARVNTPILPIAPPLSSIFVTQLAMRSRTPASFSAAGKRMVPVATAIRCWACSQRSSAACGPVTDRWTSALYLVRASSERIFAAFSLKVGRFCIIASMAWVAC